MEVGPLFSSEAGKGFLKRENVDVFYYTFLTKDGIEWTVFLSLVVGSIKDIMKGQFLP